MKQTLTNLTHKHQLWNSS